MTRRHLFALFCFASLALTGAACDKNGAAVGETTANALVAAPVRRSLAFAVTVPPGKVPDAVPGRLMVVVAPRSGLGGGEPRQRLGDVEDLREGAAFGMDASHVGSGGVLTIESGKKEVAEFPAGAVTALAPGTYTAQAVLAWNPDLRSHDAPGNLYSAPTEITVPAPDGKPFALELSEQVSPETMPDDTDTQKWLKFRSEKLSRFYGRPIYLRAGVLLPSDWKADGPTFPLCVRIGGFHTRFTSLGSRGHDGIVQVLLDGDGPFGDPYQVNSAVSGPYGDAVVQELLPEIEKRFHCGGSTAARFTTGGSTGGWVSLALQIYYPDTFGGCWSGYPDPLDFHAYQAIDLYKDASAYTDASGKEITSMRDRITGANRFTVREECTVENILAFGGSYVTSGGQWGAWNTVFGRKGKNGRAIPFWDPITGKIDHAAADAAGKRYDLRRYCAGNWKVLGPKLVGKIHLWVGEHDEYFLNGGVHRFDDFLKIARPAVNARVEYSPLAGHGWEPRSRDAILDEMIAASRPH